MTKGEINLNAQNVQTLEMYKPTALLAHRTTITHECELFKSAFNQRPISHIELKSKTARTFIRMELFTLGPFDRSNGYGLFANCSLTSVIVVCGNALLFIRTFKMFEMSKRRQYQLFEATFAHFRSG